MKDLKSPETGLYTLLERRGVAASQTGVRLG